VPSPGLGGGGACARVFPGGRRVKYKTRADATSHHARALTDIDRPRRTRVCVPGGGGCRGRGRQRPLLTLSTAQVAVDGLGLGLEGGEGDGVNMHALCQGGGSCSGPCDYTSPPPPTPALLSGLVAACIPQQVPHTPPPPLPLSPCLAVSPILLMHAPL